MNRDTPRPEAAACPDCGYQTLVLTGRGLACMDCGYSHPIPELAIAPPTADHDPCCSAHGVPMTCERYRRTHFVEVRPCCAKDRERLEQATPAGPVD